jgi:hypothetical protein
VSVEKFDDLGEIHEGPAQAVDLVDDYDVHPVLSDIGQEALEGRAIHGTAGEPAVIVGGLHEEPAFTPLAPDESLAGLPLGMQGVEILLESFLGRLAGVDRAPPCRWPTLEHAS